MPDDIMARIRAQQAQETDRANALRRQEEAEYAAANAVFLRDVSDILGILRQRRIAPRQVYSCDWDHPYFRHFEFVGMGWYMEELHTDGGYPSRVSRVLMEAGYLLSGYPMDYAARPRRYRDVLAVRRPIAPMWTWGVLVDVPGQVRKLIGE